MNSNKKTSRIADISLRQNARIAGLAYVGIFIVATYAGIVSTGPGDSVVPVQRFLDTGERFVMEAFAMFMKLYISNL